MGPGRPVFLTEARVTTGSRSARVLASHLLLLDALGTGVGTGRATVAAFPANGFSKVGSGSALRWTRSCVCTGVAAHRNRGCRLCPVCIQQGVLVQLWHAGSPVQPTPRYVARTPCHAPAVPPQYEFHLRRPGCAACPERTFLSSQPTVEFSGLPSGVLFRVTVFGLAPNKPKVPGYNWLAFRTQAARRPPAQPAALVRLLRADPSAEACGNTAVVVAGGTSGGAVARVLATGAIVKAREAAGQW